MRTFATAFVLLALAGAASAQWATPEEAITSTTGNSSTPSLDMFYSYIMQESLDNLLANPTKAQTFFAPSDAAFAKLNLTDEAQAELASSGNLAKILRYHVVGTGGFTAEALTKLATPNPVTMQTLLKGSSIIIGTTMDAAMSKSAAPAAAVALPAAAGAAAAAAAAKPVAKAAAAASPKPAASAASPKPAASPSPNPAGRRLMQEAGAGTPEPLFVGDGTNTAQVVMKNLSGGKTIIHIIDNLLVPPGEVTEALQKLVAVPPPVATPVGVQGSSAGRATVSVAAVALPLVLAALA